MELALRTTSGWTGLGRSIDTAYEDSASPAMWRSIGCCLTHVLSVVFNIRFVNEFLGGQGLKGERHIT